MYLCRVLNGHNFINIVKFPRYPIEYPQRRALQRVFCLYFIVINNSFIQIFGFLLLPGCKLTRKRPIFSAGLYNREVKNVSRCYGWKRANIGKLILF